MSRTVLIIDDEGFDRVLISALLRQSGYEVIGEAANGEEGIQLAEDLKPDLITLDKRMPDIDGLDVFKTLKSKGSTSQVVLISGDDFSGKKAEFIDLGIKDVFKKPLNREEFYAGLGKIFG